MKIVTKRLDELRKMDKNVRIHPEKQIQEYIRSLKAFEQTKPIVIDETGLILVGNGLFEALLRMGRETAECNVMEGLTEAEKRKLMLADNKVFELGITDTDALEDILKDIGEDFDIPGYDASMLEMLSMSFDDVDDFVESYGAFEETEVKRIADKPEVIHTEGAPVGAPAYAPPVPVSDVGQTDKTTAEASVTRGDDTGEEGQVIICPHCGQRICL